MGKLHDQMQQDLQLRGYRPSTQKKYLSYAREFAAFHMRSPAEMGEKEIRQFLLHLLHNKKSSASYRKTYVAALKFLYTHTLKKPEIFASIPYPKVPSKLPDILSAQEVIALLNVVRKIKHRAIIMTTYACGLRISEVCTLKTEDIDSKRMLIHLRDGKRGRDRYVMLSPTLYCCLRKYWKTERPQGDYLFPGRDPGSHVRAESVRDNLKKAAADCGISKRVTPHTLRHTFATHLLEAGIDIRKIQQMLGHGSIRTTQRYTQVSARHIGKIKSPLDLIGTKDGEDIE